MEMIKLDISKAAQVLNPGTVEAYAPQVAAAQEALEKGTCAGNDFLGWLHLPSSVTEEFINEVVGVANTLREKCDYVVVAGIGGSYLGARAIIEALDNSFAWLLKASLDLSVWNDRAKLLYFIPIVPPLFPG